MRMEIELDNVGGITLGWSGRTYSLRSAFDDAEIPLCENGVGGLIRVLNGSKASIASESDVDRLVKIIRDDLRQCPCLVYVETVPEDDPESGKSFGRVRAFVDTLRSLRHLYVKMGLP